MNKVKPMLNLGAWRHLDGAEGAPGLWLPAEHLVTHGVVVGMAANSTADCAAPGTMNGASHA